ncbi:MAG TPA: YidC/Oxa1 family membrane protein insertase [Acidimicrobiales bacterium]
MLFASSIGQIGAPFYHAFAWVLALIYGAIPNYAIAIALLTILVMIVVFPVTLKGTRGMMKMQLLAPELKKIQARHKTSPGVSAEEKSEARKALNEEMMALYKENNTSPTGGCLPLFLQMPMFLILYGTIKGLTHKTSAGKLDPLYIAHTSRLYESIIHANGALRAFGVNLADSVKTHGLSWGGKAPYILMILLAVGLQYLQMKQLSGRNPAAQQANPQMQQMQKIFPLIFAVIYISIPAAVNVYFIVSSLFRVGQQEFMYRHDPELQASLNKLKARTPATTKVLDVKGVPAPPKGRLAALRSGISQQTPSEPAPEPAKPPSKSTTPPRYLTKPAPSPKPRQPRAANNRPRRPR